MPEPARSTPAATTTASQPTSAAVIHDLGYRPYEGERQGLPAIAWSLFVLGVRHAFGLGRNAKAKVLPWILVTLAVGPALLLAVIPLIVKSYFDVEVPRLMEYHRYQNAALVVSVLFTAAAAPILLSRDLRFKTLPLYFARPLPRAWFVLVRLASLAAAILVVIGVPVLVLYAGALLGDYSFRDETPLMLKAMLGAILLSLLLAGLGGAIASSTPQRGLGTVAIVAVLLIAATIVTTVTAIAEEEAARTTAQIAGLFSPYTLVSGATGWWFDRPPVYGQPETLTMGLIYTVVLLGSILVLTLWTVRRNARRGAAA
ncbi:hypothetical protein [Kribbia dieselivorans]|uniref:hypothetical protein n=1 Tax=Kribbia dieselivorans TaxID=331526 RepID=UPI0008387982|nr:hypothetical protein [Kribbia dieselivorans]